MSEPLLIPPREAAKLLSISERKLWSMTASGDMPHLKLGRLVRYSPAELQAWILDRGRPKISGLAS